MFFRLTEVHIKRFRSIQNLKLDLSQHTDFISICGKNNAGKTNILRAINIFFNPDLYSPESDVPNHKKASGGGVTSPCIQISFNIGQNESTTKSYTIERNFKSGGTNKLTLKDSNEGEGETSPTSDQKEQLCEELISQVKVFFVESINVSIPELVSTVVDDVYEKEFETSRFSGAKRSLKKNFDNYQQGVLDILNNLASQMNSSLHEYHEKWNFKFVGKNDIGKFKDLISQDIELLVEDGSDKSIEAKGAGLQRLSYILLNFRIIEKIQESTPVLLLIDEPDAYMHPGLQKKLLKDISQVAKKCEVLITTHSPVFVNTHELKDVFLLDLEISSKFYQRRNREYSVLDTKLVDLSTERGSQRIREHLGVSLSDQNLLNPYTVFVEGESDKMYLESLMDVFGLESPVIEVLHGADNALKKIQFYSDFYRGIYQDRMGQRYKPKVLLLLDNDNKGREVADGKLQTMARKSNTGLDLKIVTIFNFNGKNRTQFGSVHKKSGGENIEIEDLVYPKLICFLVNKLFREHNLNELNSQKLIEHLQIEHFERQGIIKRVEEERACANLNKTKVMQMKDEKNKKKIASLLESIDLSQETNHEVRRLIIEENEKYPKVKEFLQEIAHAWD